MLSNCTWCESAVCYIERLMSAYNGDAPGLPESRLASCLRPEKSPAHPLLASREGASRSTLLQQRASRLRFTRSPLVIYQRRLKRKTPSGLPPFAFSNNALLSKYLSKTTTGTMAARCLRTKKVLARNQPRLSSASSCFFSDRGQHTKSFCLLSFQRNWIQSAGNTIPPAAWMTAFSDASTAHSTGDTGDGSPILLLLMLLLLRRPGWNAGWGRSRRKIEEEPRTPTRTLRTQQGRR